MLRRQAGVSDLPPLHSGPREAPLGSKRAVGEPPLTKRPTNLKGGERPFIYFSLTTTEESISFTRVVVCISSAVQVQQKTGFLLEAFGFFPPFPFRYKRRAAASSCSSPQAHSTAGRGRPGKRQWPLQQPRAVRGSPPPSRASQARTDGCVRPRATSRTRTTLAPRPLTKAVLSRKRTHGG